jgi:putative ABC transport system ATP-binding protein
MLLAITMASRAKVLLLDEATSGLDNETERLVEESIVEYAKKNGVAVLWVTHSDDIVERLLSWQC